MLSQVLLNDLFIDLWDDDDIDVDLSVVMVSVFWVGNGQNQCCIFYGDFCWNGGN